MLGRTRRSWSAAGRAGERSALGRPSQLRVDVARADAAVRARVQQLGTATGALEVVTDGQARIDVVVVSVGDGTTDGEVVAELRREHRNDPDRRIVVVGRGTTWFDAAFGAGVDAWVDHTADDSTVLAAIVGPR